MEYFCFMRHTFGQADGFLCTSPKFLNPPLFTCGTAVLKQSCSQRSPGLVRGRSLGKCTSGLPVPSPLAPRLTCSAIRPGSNQNSCSYILGLFFTTAILFNIAPEELCSVLQSLKYKSSLNLSLKYSCLCQERILAECGPAFPSLIWRL